MLDTAVAVRAAEDLRLAHPVICAPDYARAAGASAWVECER